MIELEPIKRTDPRILDNMAIHYSAPKGFVGRNICYAVIWGGSVTGRLSVAPRRCTCRDAMRSSHSPRGLHLST